MRHAVQTFGVWEKTERATKQCEFCKLWFDRVDARHYRTCIFIPDEERSQKSAWLEELKKDRKRVAERERYARKRKLAAQVQGQPQSHDNAQFLPQGPILNNEEDLMDEGLDDMCMSYGGEASADAQMGMDGVTQEEVQQDEEFVDSHLTRALCDVIQAVNQKKADNLLKSIPRILRESGRTKFAQAFKDLKTFQDCVASASQRTQLTATKVLTAAGIQCYVYHVPDAKQLLHEMLLKVGQHKIQEPSPGAELLPIAFYSDKTLTSSSRSLYPVNLFLPSANKHSVYKENSYRCIGLVPEPPIVTGVLTTKFFKSLRKWLTYTAMQIILEPFKEISKAGTVLNIDGIAKKYYPIPVFYVADLLEYQTIFGISASVSVPDSFPDPSYLVRTKDLDLNQKFMSIPKRRSEENTLKRIEIAQRMNRSGASEETIHKLKKFSLDPLLLNSPRDDREWIFKG